MFFSAITVYLRDISHILGIVTMAWQFLTPIMYPIEMIPEEYKVIFMLNPMTSVVIAYREILFYGRMPGLELWGYMLIPAIIFTVFGFIAFNRLKKGFAEEI